jgi:hypothetical protein
LIDCGQGWLLFVQSCQFLARRLHLGEGLPFLFSIIRVAGRRATSGNHERLVRRTQSLLCSRNQP